MKTPVTASPDTRQFYRTVYISKFYKCTCIYLIFFSGKKNFKIKNPKKKLSFSYQCSAVIMYLIDENFDFYRALWMNTPYNTHVFFVKKIKGCTLLVCRAALNRFSLLFLLHDVAVGGPKVNFRFSLSPPPVTIIRASALNLFGSSHPTEFGPWSQSSVAFFCWWKTQPITEGQRDYHGYV